MRALEREKFSEGKHGCVVWVSKGHIRGVEGVDGEHCGHGAEEAAPSQLGRPKGGTFLQRKEDLNKDDKWNKRILISMYWFASQTQLDQVRLHHIQVHGKLKWVH